MNLEILVEIIDNEHVESKTYLELEQGFSLPGVNNKIKTIEVGRGMSGLKNYHHIVLGNQYYPETYFLIHYEGGGRHILDLRNSTEFSSPPVYKDKISARLDSNGGYFNLNLRKKDSSISKAVIRTKSY